MTDRQIRVGRATDADRYRLTDETVWFEGSASVTTDEALIGLTPENRFAAELDGAVDPQTYPGVYGVFPLTLTIPGPESGLRQVPCAGLTWVGVHPDHRRRGILTAMLRHHFEQVHEEAGTHVSALHASEPAIYGRHGYGLASVELAVELGQAAALTAPALEQDATHLSTQFATLSDPGMPQRLHACHQRAAGLGSVVGELPYYRRICFQPPEELRDKEPFRVLFARRDGVDLGFAIFRRTPKWEKARPAGELDAWAFVGDPVAQLVLLRRLVGFDLLGSVKLRRVGVDDPLLLWAGGPRATSDVATYDSLWVRLVDLPEALEDRSWSAPCDVVVEVEDASAPWNQGNWRIHADDGGHATVERTSTDADVRLPVQALGGAYLGGGNLVAQHRAGLVTERRPGAAQELWQAMRTAVAPGPAMGF